MTTDTSEKTIDVSGRGVTLIRRLAVANRGMVTLQVLSAGFLMSGYARALLIHAIVAATLEVGALIQAVTAVVLWARRRVPASVAGFGVALAVIVFLQAGLGYRRTYWLHVPIAVGLLGWLTRQVNALDALSRADPGLLAGPRLAEKRFHFLDRPRHRRGQPAQS
jgi:hypothetical protein